MWLVEGVRKTGSKVKRGVNEVRDSIKHHVKDLGREVEQSVVEVADAVKVRLRACVRACVSCILFTATSRR